MDYSPVAARYAQAAFEAAQEARQVDETLEQLEVIRQLLHGTPEARHLLFNPDVDPEDKVQVLDRIFHGQWSSLVRALMEVVIRFGRTEYLDEMVGAFAEAVDTAHGRLRGVVRTARPLTAASLARLRGILQQREGKEVLLSAELDPSLLGGVQVLLGHRLIDSSIRHQLVDLRERLGSVRVH